MVFGSSDCNHVPFIPLRELGLTERKAIDLLWKLKTFLEDRNPGHKVDVSGMHILTVSPFADGDEIPDEYEVINYAIGICYDKPALLNMGENSELLMLETIENDFLTTQLNKIEDEAIATHEFGECPFCHLSNKEDFIVETPTAFAIYDKCPVSPGHALVIPKRHIASYFNLSIYEKMTMTDLSQYVMKKIDERFHPDGYNVGINIGEAAGQSVFHCHMHVIPRYKGDVPNPKGGVRGVIPSKQSYSTKKRPEKPSASTKNDIKQDEI